MLLATAAKPALIFSVMVAEKKIPQVVFSHLEMKGKGLPKCMEYSPTDVTPGLAKQNANFPQVQELWPCIAKATTKPRQSCMGKGQLG